MVFATKGRQHVIETEIEKRVYAILFSILKKYGAVVYRIGGMPDHVHILTTIPPTLAVSSLIKNLKRESSLVIGQDKFIMKWPGWQEGYGCFSYSRHEKEKIINYIKCQKEHHRKISFLEEYRQWLIENGVSPQEKYFPK